MSEIPWWIVASHPDGEWEKVKGPFYSEQDVEMMRKGIIDIYSMLGSFCPKVEVIRSEIRPRLT